jgi:glycosyltransferase involved in cell wall biosynthesis
MRIAFVVPGGVNASAGHVIPCLVWLIERLGRRHAVHVFPLFHGPDPASWTLHGAQVQNIGSRPGWRRRLYRTIGAAHAHTPFDVIHVCWGGLGVHAALAGWRHRVPVVLSCMGGEFAGDAFSNYGARLTWQGRASIRAALFGAKRVTVQTQFMADLAAAAGARPIVVPFGVALDRWPARQPRPRPGSQPLQLLHVGDLRPVKDQMMLLDAMAGLRARGVNYHLHMAGVDHLDGLAQERAVQLGLTDRITWHGLLNREALRTAFEASDLLVMSSRHEAGPIVTLEAAALGIPTVGTAVGHIADWAPIAAVAVPIGDADAMGRELEALDRDEPRRLMLGTEALRRATAEDADHTARCFEALYAEVTGTDA